MDVNARTTSSVNAFILGRKKKKGICITLGLVNRDLLKDLNVSVRNEFDFLREDWWVQDFRISNNDSVERLCAIKHVSTSH